MSKKILKRSLALGALMAFVITGSAMAADLTEADYKGVVDVGAAGQVAIDSLNMSIVIGDKAKDTNGDDANETKAESGAVAIGQNAIAGTDSIAIGSSAAGTQATGINSVAIGGAAKAQGQNSVAIGRSAVATVDNTVSFGDQTLKREIVNIAEGTTDNSAVNKKQMDTALTLKANAADVYTKTETDNAITSAVTGKADKATTLAGYGITDAYTKSEVDTHVGNVTDHVNRVSGELTDLNTEVENGFAELNKQIGITNGYVVGNMQDISELEETKANKADVYTKGEVDTHIGNVTDHVNRVSGELTNLNTEVENGFAELNNQIGITNGYVVGNMQAIGELENQVGNNAAAISGINQRLDRTNAKINKVGAGAAALAALHPLDYDPDDKLTFAVGMGNYAGENAAALGAFYRPNEKFMVSLGGTMGNGENMINLGLSIGLDKASGLVKLSKKELIQKVNAVEAENDALEDRVAKLEALVAQLASK